MKAPNLNLYQYKDRGYIDAHYQCSQMLKRGEILAFSSAYISGDGRVLTVETNQGWNPNAVYRDIDYLGEYDA